MRVLVTVWCLTYNHVEYIQKALDSFLAQIVDFPIKIFVFDDASTDGTSDIVRDYANKYPELVDAYIAEKNIGLAPENKKIRDDIIKQHLCGKYIAWCEGDDYWTDPNKLQIQVDYMEKHPECVMCAHASERMDYGKNEKYEYHPYDADKDISEEEIFLMSNGNLTTASIMLRRDIQFPDEKYPCADVGDVTMQWYAISKGKIHYIDRVMCVYRYHHPGSWGQRQQDSVVEQIKHAATMSLFLEEYDKYTEKRFDGIVKQVRNRYLNYAIEVASDKSETELEEILMSQVHNEKIGFRVAQILLVRKNIISSTTKLNDDDISQLKGKRVLIFGTGKYSAYAEKLLRNSNIMLDGYMVSDIKKLTCAMKQPTWDLHSFLSSECDTAIVMGVSQRVGEEIIEDIKKLPKVDIICPFWIEWTK